MPNWAMGDVQVTGTKKAVLSFCDRFITSDEPVTLPGRKYFARSFVGISRETLHQDVEDYFEHADESEERTMSILISFAWSALSCMISGYPQTNPEECILLADACKADNVSVEIRTVETGMGFEEEIHCDKTGECTRIERDLQEYVCPECGEFTYLASFEDPDDGVCGDCGHEGLVLHTEEDSDEP